MGKKHRIIRNLLLDAMAAGLALTVFALFHHVLPREQQSLNVRIENPAAQETTAKTISAIAETVPESETAGVQETTEPEEQTETPEEDGKTE